MMFVCRPLVLCLIACGLCLTSHNEDILLSVDFMPLSPWAEEVSLSEIPYFQSPDVFQDPHNCSQLLPEFANVSAALSGCLVLRARPARLCQGCYQNYVQLVGIMQKINQKFQNTSDSCAKSLLQSDRVQLLVIMNEFFEQTWSDSKCTQCLEKNSTAMLTSTIKFMALFDEVNTCFHNNMQAPSVYVQQRNLSRVCANCSAIYKNLSALYSELENANELCIDLEDAMNSTRHLWSTMFNCTVPCTDTVPVIAVSAFIIFLPVVFYLSSFLHSEQKKRKLILPKRIKSNAAINIQDKSS
ncbi:osteopetrosis-associated transmembrane protein 1 [Bombina bombina]|uniref:osteopetrosis-associated transmembrane protein 1 n=1 Tax=Bombina bombina TaxID=8345 RepID=UPI00235B02A9|nr:osteopetrosis-associated transmembrane protein 1 [Bombina bombina]